jgi:hypothetical protein
MANWNPKIPLNFRTIVFCLLMGTVLSVPAGNLLDSPLQLLTPSQKASMITRPSVDFVFSYCLGGSAS